MNRFNNKLNFYRIILLLGAVTYLLYSLVYIFTPEINDPLSFGERAAAIIIFFTTFSLSFKNNWVKKNINLISYFLSVLAILHLFYYNYQFKFRLELAITTIIIIAIFNLVFNLNKIKIFTNIGLVILIGISLYLAEDKEVISSLYLTSYILSAALSYIISYNIEKYHRKTEKNLKERKTVLNTIDTQVWYLKEPTIYGLANKAHCQFLGVEIEEIENKSVYQFLDSKEAETCKLTNQKVFTEKEKIQTEEWAENAAGEKRLLSIIKSPKLNKAGKVEYVVCSAEDITDKKEQRKKLESQYKFQKTLAQISSELVNIGLENVDEKINHSLKILGKFFGVDRSYIFKISEDRETMSNKYEWTAPEIKAQKQNLQNLEVEKYNWWLGSLSEDKPLIIEDIEQLSEVAPEEKKILEAQNVESLIVLPIFIEDKLYGFLGFDLINEKVDFKQRQVEQLKIFADVITRAISKHQDNLKIKRLSYYDSLTGLYNRRFFEIEVERLDTKRQLPISIIMADLNGLKIINDSYGHQKGDELLQKTAEILESSIRKEDILARQGGDEFIILLPQTTKSNCAEIRQRIKSKTLENKEQNPPISIALGQATKNKRDEDIEEIIKKADDQMYENKLSESRSSKSNIVQGLLNALDAKSNETKEHAMRMTKLAFDFGELLELSESEQNRLSLLATLHDIGKINISEAILNKADKLTEKEWEIMKKHTEQGYKIASSSEEFASVADEIFSHHEYWDGSGYPRNLEAEDIPYLARIISLIDAYDVMTNDRPYSKAMSKEEALTEIKSCAGTQFDPELAEKFVELLTTED